MVRREEDLEKKAPPSPRIVLETVPDAAMALSPQVQQVQTTPKRPQQVPQQYTTPPRPVEASPERLEEVQTQPLQHSTPDGPIAQPQVVQSVHASPEQVQQPPAVQRQVQPPPTQKSTQPPPIPPTQRVIEPAVESKPTKWGQKTAAAAAVPAATIVVTKVVEEAPPQQEEEEERPRPDGDAPLAGDDEDMSEGSEEDSEEESGEEGSGSEEEEEESESEESDEESEEEEGDESKEEAADINENQTKPEATTQQHQTPVVPVVQHPAEPAPQTGGETAV